MIQVLRHFDFSAEKELASKLAAHVEKNLSPKLMGDRRHILSANKITRVLEQAFEQVTDHKAKSGMSFVKRAVLANSLKWELRNKGFPDDFISVITEGLVVTMSRNKATNKV